MYDGASTEDPVLVRLCGGGAIPDIISSGSHMLLEFHTSPYDNPFHPVPLSYLPGFELDVEVITTALRYLYYVSSFILVREHLHKYMISRISLLF